MKNRPALALSTLALAAIFAAGCAEDAPPLVTIEGPPEVPCERDETPTTYEVYFVIDVSGSMAPFLNGVSKQLEAFARGFPERDANDVRVIVNYYVVGYVNDVKWFPESSRRMTSPIAVQAAFEQAIGEGSDNQNLNQAALNADSEENLLDALAQVIGNNPQADAVLVLIATDAGFVEAPETLTLNIQVQSTYASIRADLEARGIRLHIFTTEAVDGLTRMFRGQPSLSALPGATLNRLSDLTGASDRIRLTLEGIAEGAACN